MTLVELFAPTTREALAAPIRATPLAPTLIPVCCVCKLIRDETGSSSDRTRWVTPWTYRVTHGVNPDDSRLTHTYCPTYFTKAQETVVQYFRQIGATS